MQENKMNIHLPNFNMKNLVKEAGTTLSRVVQVCVWVFFSVYVCVLLIVTKGSGWLEEIQNSFS